MQIYNDGEVHCPGVLLTLQESIIIPIFRSLKELPVLIDLVDKPSLIKSPYQITAPTHRPDKVFLQNKNVLALFRTIDFNLQFLKLLMYSILIKDQLNGHTDIAFMTI